MLDPNNLTSELLGLAKSLRIDDRKWIRIGFIRTRLRRLRASILESVRLSRKTNFSSCLGIKSIWFCLACFSPFALTAEQEEKEQCLYIFDAYPTMNFPFSAHSLSNVSALGDTIELEDGSIWKISKYDRPKVLSCFSKDALFITQNYRWFSKYDYRIVLQNTGACLEAALLAAPHEHGDLTLHISEIDEILGNLVLTNGFNETSSWNISSCDLAIFQTWTLKDCVIIGQNSGWDLNCEALLINTHQNNCIRAKKQ